MIGLDLKESCELCDWLMKKGLHLSDCAEVLCDMQLGDSLGLALLKMYFKKKQRKEDEQISKHINDWDNPIIC